MVAMVWKLNLDMSQWPSLRVWCDIYVITFTMHLKQDGVLCFVLHSSGWLLFSVIDRCIDFLVPLSHVLPVELPETSCKTVHSPVDRKYQKAYSRTASWINVTFLQGKPRLYHSFLQGKPRFYHSFLQGKPRLYHSFSNSSSISIQK